jgi:hypothetical protein
MPLRAAIPSTVTNPTSDPSDRDASAEPRGEHAADERKRQREGDEQYKARRLKVGEQQGEDAGERSQAEP